jgi:ABC-type multidrug transport system fused ATPase/permease subunit
MNTNASSDTKYKAVKVEDEKTKDATIDDSKKEDSKKIPEEPVIAKNKYGLWDFTKFTVPYLWKGGLLIRIQTVLTVVLLFISRGLNVLHPIILKYIIDSITCQQSSLDQQISSDCFNPPEHITYLLIGMYCVTRFTADFANNIREIPFANISASAEIHIAQLVYTHITNQSLAFHLSRETGKVIRIVSRGSQSFAMILRYSLFNIVPIIVEVIMVQIIIATIYPYQFVIITFSSVIIYVLITVILTEWRAKYFKLMATKDTEYN